MLGGGGTFGPAVRRSPTGPASRGAQLWPRQATDGSGALCPDSIRPRRSSISPRHPRRASSTRGPSRFGVRCWPWWRRRARRPRTAARAPWRPASMAPSLATSRAKVGCRSSSTTAPGYVRHHFRGVAWPTTGRSYAVGDNGAMFVWRTETGLWGSGPGQAAQLPREPQRGRLDPSNPDIGYAVGKQGVLLAWGKTWTQQALPASVAQAQLTSVAFAGHEALVAYRQLNPANPAEEEGGVLVNDGSGWTVDPSAAALLATLPPGQTVISKVAGAPRRRRRRRRAGGVLERDSATSPWRFSSVPLADSLHGKSRRWPQSATGLGPGARLGR